MRTGYSLVTTAPPADLTPYALRHDPGFTGTASFAGPLRLADGSGPAPALAFTGAAGTGLLRDGAGALAVAVGGVPRVSVGATATRVGEGATDALATGLVLVETGHATSRRAALQIGEGWLLGQDSQGSGLRDAVLLNRATSQAALLAEPDGTLRLAGPAGAETVQVTRESAQVNRLRITGGAAGSGPTLAAEGASANVPLTFMRRGSGGINLSGPDAQPFGVEIGAGATGDRITVIDLHAQAGADYSARLLRSAGAAGLLEFRNAGGGGILFKTGAINSEAAQLVVAHMAGAVNHVQASGAASGAAPGLSAQGSDPDVDLALWPKGAAGRLRFGGFTAGGDQPVIGHIEIRDAAGTLRRLAVVA